MFFSKITTNEHHELFKWANEKPLRWAVLMTMAARVSTKDSITTNLKKGELYFSETECRKFGLRDTQKNNLRSVIIELLAFGVIQKEGSRKGRKGASIYRFINSDFIDCSKEKGSEVGTLKGGQGEDEGRTRGQTKNDLERLKKVKNEESHTNKKKFSEFVFLEETEYEKLLEKFGEFVTKEKINDLNNYIGSTGKKYKSHYHTILNWDRKNNGSVKQHGKELSENIKALLAIEQSKRERAEEFNQGGGHTFIS